MQARVDDARDGRMALQIKRDLPRIAAVLAHPEGQRLQPLDKLESIEGAHAHTHVAQQHDPRADDVGEGPSGFTASVQTAP